MSKRNTVHILFPGMNKFYCGVGLDIGHRYITFMRGKARIVEVGGKSELCPRCVKRSEVRHT